ncbi:hypothetical protein GIB67_030688 [Kingdonia uniflora]|uniref:Uncharacterized protein n=1 Tax=Kingdonia uniflora TaxID=39325 RepID=A0A7J7NIH7_9MAGN|nr:hypothetical protein GIB67_030688 [Kingdonia uniflora]
MASQQISSSGVGLFGGSSSNSCSIRVSSINGVRLLSTSTTTKKKKKTSFQRLVVKSDLKYSSAAQTKPQGAEVVATGEVPTLGESKVNISDKAGFQVLCLKHAGTKVNFNGSRHLILKDDDIIEIIENDEIRGLKLFIKDFLIKLSEADSKTAGGLLLAESIKGGQSVERSASVAFFNLTTEVTQLTLTAVILYGLQTINWGDVVYSIISLFRESKGTFNIRK